MQLLIRYIPNSSWLGMKSSPDGDSCNTSVKRKIYLPRQGFDLWILLTTLWYAFGCKAREWRPVGEIVAGDWLRSSVNHVGWHNEGEKWKAQSVWEKGELHFRIEYRSLDLEDEVRRRELELMARWQKWEIRERECGLRKKIEEKEERRNSMRDHEHRWQVPLTNWWV